MFFVSLLLVLFVLFSNLGNHLGDPDFLSCLPVSSLKGQECLFQSIHSLGAEIPEIQIS